MIKYQKSQGTYREKSRPFAHDTSVATAPSSLSGAYNRVYLATAEASAQIPLRGTSDTLGTLDEISSLIRAEDNRVLLRG
jgi:hypothetical protein